MQELKGTGLKQRYAEHASVAEMEGLIRDSHVRRIHARGLHGSSRSLLASCLISSVGGVHLMIEPDREEAAYLYQDLVNLVGDAHVAFFPSSFKRTVQFQQLDQGNMVLRANLLKRLKEDQLLRGNGGAEDKFLVIVCCAEGLAEKVISAHALEKHAFPVAKGEKVDLSFLQEVLDAYDFTLTDFVQEPGQYAVRGSIVDVFSYANPDPYRIDFFGNEVESIRDFDVETQLSRNLLEKITLLPNLKERSTEDTAVPLFDYLSPDVFTWITDIPDIAARLGDIEQHLTSGKGGTDAEMPAAETLMMTKSDFLDRVPGLRTIEFSSQRYFQDAVQLQFNTVPQPAFNKNFNLLAGNLSDHLSEDYTIYILTDNEKQTERLRDIFHDINASITFTPVLHSLHEGFIDRDRRICCYTDHQIFERYHKYSIHNYFSNKASLTAKELVGLQPGDYVVHIDHGIGVFGGLEKIINNGKVQESVRLVYQDQDILYVSIHALHRISKYRGKENDAPRLHKLGQNAWHKLKQNTKNKIKDIARGLITLYATRKMNEGFSFSPDSYLQTELEASFVYEDTPDQLKATQAVKEDMESVHPMDRLVCGDVGFGKTEVAIRAAFKAVAESKQVALLVPTTILALQHYHTFRDRLSDFPCNVEYLNRFRKGSEQKEVLKALEAGRVDILIGTHRLLGSDIKFKDLGLLIVDEEQKFGVSSKEKLRNLKANVDTLTLTATPIPRTLQFSLMGVRDLSVINTPPPNRHPIQTELHPFNEDIIREGIMHEISRGGQVFFIHNRIQNLHEMAETIRRLCPKTSLVVAHGQMKGPELEKNMTDFIRGDYDVLVSTAIIESGLDIPNANTIFINNAHHFGLSDLHQLRGRVGRSNKRAFCYLLSPAPSLLTPEAKRRLKAIEEFSELGSGFNIALQDLDIRGAGNMLGAEQSGFIADVGFEAYNQILGEAIQELRQQEFPDWKGDKDDKTATAAGANLYINDCQIDTDMELLFPEEYVSSISERMYLYRELDQISSEEDLAKLRAQLEDRFGPLPGQAEELLRVVPLRWLAIRLGFEKLILRNGKMIGHFISDQGSAFYSSPVFSHILSFVQKEPAKFRMKEAKDKLTLTCEPVLSIKEATDLLARMDKADHGNPVNGG